MQKLTSPIRATWNCARRLIRAWPLMRYGAGQHDLICDVTGTSRDYLDGGCTAFESVCVLMLKLDAARQYLAKQEDENSAKLLKLLNTQQDDEEFCFLPLKIANE